MHEPPSDQLVRQLTELQLCRPRDLHRARGRVRRLSYDLPAFDSVWIDSLVQLRLLTPYQARQLELGQGEGLRIGSLVAIDELGRSSRGSTYLARPLHRRDRCVVKRQSLSPHQLAQTRQQMERVLQDLDGFVHPQLVVPHESMPSDEDELVLVSRFVPGLPLNELLVRRGRFPATVVVEIGRQLLEGLAALHTKSLVHGDIRLSNIRLTDSGLAVLVNGAIRPVIHPQVTIHDSLPLDAYDGLAPELIGTGATASASSELYALGCALWQLLTGRPPFVSADPLTKIASHQTRAIEDVRAWAPDTPAMLADSIRQMTASSPNARPRSFQEVLQHWGQPGSYGRSRLRQFRRLFNGSVPHFSRTSSLSGAGTWVWTAAVLVGITSAIALFYDHGLRTELLNVGQNLETIFQASGERQAVKRNGETTATAETHAENAVRGLMPLPAPTDDGVILLKEAGPYEASTITYDGRLTIRAEVAAEIHVGNVPLSLSAIEVTLDRIVVRRVLDDPMLAAMTVRSNSLNLLNCEFVGFGLDQEAVRQTDQVSASSSSNRSTFASSSLVWKRIGGRDSHGGHIVIQNSVFHGNGVALLLAQTPQVVRVENTLKTGSAALVALGPKTVGTELTLDLERVTLRESGSLLQIGGELAGKAGAPSVQIKATNCAFNLSNNHSALVLVDSDRSPAELVKVVEMAATESVVEPGTILFARYDRTRDQLIEIDGDDQFEGLAACEIKFAGPRIHSARDAKVASIQGPRTSETTLPGVDLALLGAKIRR